LLFQEFRRNLRVVKYGHRSAAAKVGFRAERGRILRAVSCRAFDGFFPITLAGHKHTTFQTCVLARAVLDHETVTDTVTVTVR
jgi:hypothetical protein